MTETCIHWHPIRSLLAMGKTDNVECELATTVFHDDANYGCDHPYAVKNRITKTRLHAIPESRFVVEHTTESTTGFDAISKVTKAKVTELVVQAVSNVTELFL